MRTFTARFRIANFVDPARSVEIEAQVDVDANYSWIAKQTLEAIAARPLNRRTVRKASGELVRREVAPVRIMAEGAAAVENVLVAEGVEGQVIGRFTLEALGLAVDPVTQRLVAVRTWTLAATA